jgi:hypothetical protein
MVTQLIEMGRESMMDGFSDGGHGNFSLLLNAPLVAGIRWRGVLC